MGVRTCVWVRVCVCACGFIGCSSLAVELSGVLFLFLFLAFFKKGESQQKQVCVFVCKATAVGTKKEERKFFPVFAVFCHQAEVSSKSVKYLLARIICKYNFQLQNFTIIIKGAFLLSK